MPSFVHPLEEIYQISVCQDSVAIIAHNFGFLPKSGAKILKRNDMYKFIWTILPKI